MTYAQLRSRVREHLGQEHRFAHSVRVARTAESLARAHGADPAKARLAGMLHDLARLYPPQRLLEECTRRQIPVGDFERRNPIVLHAPLGAALARERFGVDDPQVLSAIAKHTVAAPRMSPLDCAVYLADALEPGRCFAERERLARLAREDLPAAMRETLATTLRHLRERRVPVAPQTLEAARAFGVAADDLEVQTA